MKQQTLMESSEDDDSGHSDPLPVSDNSKVGLPRMLSQRMMGDSDRKNLLTKSSDSKRSLLSRGLSRSMVKLKNTVKQMGDNDDQENYEEKAIPLMEHEMLKARFHVSEGVVMQQKEEIEQLKMQLNEKDDVIDSLMHKLEAMSSANNSNITSTPQRSKGPPKQTKRMSSLDEKRLKKRQMERAHQLGLSRSPSLQKMGLQTSLEAALNFEQEEEIGNPSTAADDGADSHHHQSNNTEEPISGTPMVRVSSKASLVPDLREGTPQTPAEYDRPRSPRSGRKMLGNRQSSNRSFRRKNSVENLHNSGLSLSASESSQYRTNTNNNNNSPRQLERRLIAASSSDGRTSPKPNEDDGAGFISPNRRRGRHQFPKQLSKRNFRRKASNGEAETGDASTTTNDNSDNNPATTTTTPRQSEKTEPTSTRATNNNSETRLVKDRSKSPHRRGQHERPSSNRQKRANRRKNSMLEGFHNSSGTSSSNDDSLDFSSPQRQTERRVLITSSAAAATVEETNNNKGRTDASKSPHRRPLNKQSSKRSINHQTAAAEEEQTTTPTPGGDPPSSPRNRRGGKTIRPAANNSRGPSRRRSDDTPPDAVQNFRHRAQARSAKAREGMKQNDRANDESNNNNNTDFGAELPLAFGSPLRNELGDRNEESLGSKPNSSIPSTLPNTILVLPASMGKDFKDQDVANSFDRYYNNEPMDEKPEVGNEKGGFLVNFGDSPFGRLEEATNNDDQLPSGHEGVDTQDSSQEDAYGVINVDNEKRSNESKEENSLSNLDSIAFATNFTMMSMAEIPEISGDNITNDSNMPQHEQKPSQPTVPPRDANGFPTNVGSSSSTGEVEPSEGTSERVTTESSKPQHHATDSGGEGIAAKPDLPTECPSSPIAAHSGKDNRNSLSSSSRGRDYLLKMNRNETLAGDAAVGESSRSRSLSPGWVSPRTPSGRKKLRIKKISPRTEAKTKKEPNLNKDYLKAAFQKNVKKFVKLNDQFQQMALPTLQAEKSVDIRSISSSLSNLDEVIQIVDESKIDEIRLSPMSEGDSGKILVPPPPPTSAMSPPLTANRPKKNKTVHWELEQNLFRLLVIPLYDKQQKKDCFYNEAEIKQMRFDLFMEQHATDMDIDSIGDEMMADEILDDMSFADEIVSDEDINIDMESIRGIENRRGSM